MKKQVFNPYLPLDVCIPDGEPHVFGDRLYVFGSHDKKGGDKFCMLDYEFWSAPTNDLSDWSSNGTNYSARQDPDYLNGFTYMYAPDVVKGNDGRYYLYYCMSGEGKFTSPVHVAVCDTPDGRYEYYGIVRNGDGTAFTDNVTFDPAVINDNGTVRLYYGWSIAVDGNVVVDKEKLIEVQMWMFGKTRDQITAHDYGVMGSFVVSLGDDMLTVTTKPELVAPGQFASQQTSFDGHAFFEGSSIRKIGDKYYFVYSSQHQHELCYATSDYPDRDFVYGGVIVSNGDIGYNGRQEADRVYITGNNHGSIECVDGQWYVFYHRHTHKTSFSRQACAERIDISDDGSIDQVCITSCGLNGGALVAQGRYNATICCVLTNGKMPHTTVAEMTGDFPYITDCVGVDFVTNLCNGCTVGYKYFVFDDSVSVVKLSIRGHFTGRIELFAENSVVGVADVQFDVKDWTEIAVPICVTGTHALYIKIDGTGKFDLLFVAFE